MGNEELIKYLISFGVEYMINVDLKRKTWIHRGGIAGIYISPRNSKELEDVVSFMYKRNISFQLVGHTSNLYILNGCDIPVVVSTVKCNNYHIDDGLLYCEAGVGVIALAKQMIKHGVRGFEYLTGLPGTIGGALVNNSSCKENSISELLISAKVMLKDGSIKIFSPEDFEFEFRSSILKKKNIEGTILSAILKASPGNVDLMQSIADTNDKDREERLEGYAKNLGCTVNRCFINGKMSLWLRIALFINDFIIRFFIRSKEKKREQRKKFICTITGYKSIIPYISSKNPIIFSWIDEGADVVFPLYLEFMKKVYKTDKIEIEVIK